MILIDHPREYPNVRGKWSHLLSETSLEELHAFADQIGLKREWFQETHYDVTGRMYRDAVKAGAVEVTTMRQLVEAFKTMRLEVQKKQLCETQPCSLSK